MPCYTRQTSTVKFGAQTDGVLFKRAVEALGYTTTVRTDGTLAFRNSTTQGTFKADGTLEVTTGYGQSFDEKQFKRAYSTEVVKAAAQRFGWQVKQTADTTFQIQRRY